MLALHSTPAANATPAQAAPPSRLVSAAHEFEAQMMKELLQPLTAGDGLTGSEDGSAAGAQGALGEYASEALAGSLSDHGGFGIAHRIIQSLSHSGNHAESGEVTEIQHRNTAIKSLK